MGAVQIYLLISRLIAAARLEMTVGSKPITSVFTVLNSTAVIASSSRQSNKLAQISFLCRGRVKDKGDDSIWVRLCCNGWWYICIFPVFTRLKCWTRTLPACVGFATVCALEYMIKSEEWSWIRTKCQWSVSFANINNNRNLPNKFPKNLPHPAEEADLIV